MTVLAPPRPATPPSPRGGGLPARRAMMRWARRTLRREWRSQALVTLLLTFVVAIAVCGGTALYNAPPPADLTMGTAREVFVLDGGDQRATAADVESLRRAYGTVDVVGHTPRPAPGLALPVDYRAAALGGTYTAHLLAIHRGRYPSGTGEAAVTAGVARLLGTRLGGTIALDGHPRTIVGIAENPSALDDDFVLVAPAEGPPPETVSVFASGAEHGTESLRLTTLRQGLGQGTNTDRIVITTLVLTGSAILLLLVAFVAAAGFAVLAHRRLRQLGMLAAVGATARQLRFVMTAGGLLVGTVAAVAGTVVGLLAWPPAASALVPAVNHRIDRLNVPWHLLAAVALLAVAAAAAAAWWPSRAISRIPVTAALSGRPPAPRSTRRPALAAALLLGAGLACLAAGGTRNPPLIVAGTVATAGAILFAGPLAVRLLAGAGSRAPIAMRLALRDLARHQARSAAAVAAISIALGIPVATVIVATHVQATPATDNLSDRQLLVTITRPGDPPGLVPVRAAAELTALSAQVDRMAAVLTHPTVLPLDAAYDPTAPVGFGPMSRERVWHTEQLAVPVGQNRLQEAPTYVATPGLLRLVGAAAGVPPAAEAVSSRTGLVRLGQPVQGEGQGEGQGDGRGEVPVATATVPGPGYTSLPDTLLTAHALARWNLVPIRAGWLLESSAPISGAQLAQARALAVPAGLTIEARDGQPAVQTVRTSATAAGVLVALAVLAMTVGLIRGEAAADLRTLTATGATARVRRTLTATTAGGLALLGAVLGTAGAGLALAVVYQHDLGVFGRIPPAYPLVFLVGVPLVAAAAGWLLAGREPPAIARRMVP